MLLLGAFHSQNEAKAILTQEMSLRINGGCSAEYHRFTQHPLLAKEGEEL